MVYPVSSLEAVGYCVVEQARILSVDPLRKTCDLQTVYSHKTHEDVQISSPFLTSGGLGGMDFNPEPGDICYIATPAEGSGPFIFAYVTIAANSADDYPLGLDSNLSYAHSRQRLRRGEVVLRTKDKNFVEILRGGVVRIGANPRCHTMYLPIENVIRQYFDRIQSFTPLGEFIWDRIETGSEGENGEDNEDSNVILKGGVKTLARESYLPFEIAIGNLLPTVLDSSLDSNLLRQGKENTFTVLGEEVNEEIVEQETGAGDREHLLGVNAEFVGDDSLGFQPHTETNENPGLFSIVLRTDASTITFSLQFGKNGDLFLKSEENIHVEAKTVYVRATDQVKIQTRDDTYLDLYDYIRMRVNEAFLEILESGNITLEGQEITVKGSGNVTVESEGKLTLKGAESIVLDTPTVELGRGADLDLLAGASLWKPTVDAHNHAVSGAVATPSAQPLTGNGVLTSQTSTIVKVKG